MYEEHTVTSPDGSKKYVLYKEALAELLSPQDEDYADSRGRSIDFLRAACADGLSKLHDSRTVLPRYLTSQDGDLTLENQAQAHEDTIGCELSNDKFSESVFGTFDRMLRRNEGCSREAAAALAHAMRHKSFSEGTDRVKRRKQAEERRRPLKPPPPGIDYFRQMLPLEEQLSLVEYSRLTVPHPHSRTHAHIHACAHTHTHIQARARTRAHTYEGARPPEGRRR